MSVFTYLYVKHCPSHWVWTWSHIKFLVISADTVRQRSNTYISHHHLQWKALIFKRNFEVHMLMKVLSLKYRRSGHMNVLSPNQKIRIMMFISRVCNALLTSMLRFLACQVLMSYPILPIRFSLLVASQNRLTMQVCWRYRSYLLSIQTNRTSSAYLRPS